MTDNQDISRDRFSADWLLRGTLIRLGDKFDRVVGRKAATPSSLATSQLIERLKRVLDSKARDVAGKGKVVPHNIRLKVQWDKFSTDENDTLARLQNELIAAAVDHINDSLYYTFAPLDLQVTPDYFTEGVTLLANFDNFGETDDEKEMNITVPSADASTTLLTEAKEPVPVRTILHACIDPKGKTERIELEVPSDGRISVGRAGGNQLTIDDPSVSKIHASLYVGPSDVVSVADTGSTNGTFINGQRMAYGRAMKLASSEIVKFGSIEVSFEIERPQSESTEKEAESISNEQTVEIGGFEFTTRSPSESGISNANPLPAGDDQVKGESDNS